MAPWLLLLFVLMPGYSRATLSCLDNDGNQQLLL